MQVQAIKNHRYGSKQFNVGDEYEIKGKSDFNLYVALGWVREIPKMLYETNTPTVGHQKVMVAKKGKDKSKGSYKAKGLSPDTVIVDELDNEAAVGQLKDSDGDTYGAD